MAWYCKDCAEHMGFPAEEKDDSFADDEMVWEICEGCGPGWFDNQHRRLVDEG